MFIKQIISTGEVRKDLETGRSLEILLSDGSTFTGIIDFISSAHNANHIFIDSTANTRAIIKIYSNRTLIELITYNKDAVNVRQIMSINIMDNRKNRGVYFESSIPYYFSDKPEPKLVPVVVGDVFSKGGHDFKVLAITRDGGNMFLESDHGKAVTVNLNDTTLIAAFSGFKWGQPTR